MTISLFTSPPLIAHKSGCRLHQIWPFKALCGLRLTNISPSHTYLQVLLRNFSPPAFSSSAVVGTRVPMIMKRVWTRGFHPPAIQMPMKRYKSSLMCLIGISISFISEQLSLPFHPPWAHQVYIYIYTVEPQGDIQSKLKSRTLQVNFHHCILHFGRREGSTRESSTVLALKYHLPFPTRSILLLLGVELYGVRSSFCFIPSRRRRVQFFFCFLFFFLKHVHVVYYLVQLLCLVWAIAVQIIPQYADSMAVTLSFCFQLVHHQNIPCGDNLKWLVANKGLAFSL